MYDYDCYNHDLKVYKDKYYEDKYGVICEDDFIDYKEFWRIYQNWHKRKQRYKKWFEKSFKKYKMLYFITLTFSDDYIPKDSASAISFLKLFLKGVSIREYRFNIDFGDDNGRVHFHGVSTEDITPAWTYGFANCKPINLTSKSIEKVTCYVNKVVNHAFKKEQGIKFRVISSSNRKKIES